MALALRPPLGLDIYMPVPEANPLTPAKVDLGRRWGVTGDLLLKQLDLGLRTASDNRARTEGGSEAFQKIQ